MQKTKMFLKSVFSAALIALCVPNMAFGYASEVGGSSADIASSTSSRGGGAPYLGWIVNNKRCAIKIGGEFTGDELPENMAQLCGRGRDTAEVQDVLRKYVKGDLKLRSGEKSVKLAADFPFLETKGEADLAFKKTKCALEADWYAGQPYPGGTYDYFFKRCMAR